MLSDILLIGEQHRQAACEIASHVVLQRDGRLAGDPGYRFMVAVSGESGAGKSELSHALARELKTHGMRVKVLHTDNYYKVEPSLRRCHREETGFAGVGMDEYDWEQLNRNIDDFRNGRQALMPCIDILTDEVDMLTTDFSRIDVLVIDGLYAIGIGDVDLRVFIDLTYHETRKSQLLRGKEKTGSHRREVLEREHRSVRSLRHLSDLLVDASFSVREAERDCAVEGQAVASDFSFAFASN
ncbi:MAG TPA: adenylyl-sulfate kinase [Prosthecochloris aestuarii]|uniref:Adenylyl-sulfate kinase n=1 Tax=Prosthecochloris aestuarii TaxID=1102 RepID=A0A831SRA0_PROAE|nr:adenylyl-sulfate kinase [Prosthecochloris aestuarii]